MTPSLRRRLLRRTAAFAGASLLLLACGSDSGDSPTQLPLALGGGGATESTADSATMAAGEGDARIGLYQPVDYVAGPDLPELGGDRTVYRVDRGSDDALQAVADSLGIEGDLTTDGDARIIRSGNGALESYDGSFWSWFDGEAMDGVVSVACDPEGVCEEPEPPQRPATLPTEQEAESIARALLGAAGPSLDGAIFNVEDGVTNWYIDVQYVVDGMATDGLRANVVVGDGGRINSAYGPLGDVVEVGSYATISAHAAVDRLTQGWGPMPMAVDTGAPEPAIATAEGPPADDTTAGAEPAPDDPAIEPAPEAEGSEPAAPRDEPIGDERPVEEYEEPEPVTVTLTDAEWTLVSFWSWDDSGVYLLPAYRYTADDGSAPVVPAVTDDVIAPPPSDEGERPTPEPGTDGIEEGGTGGESSPGSAGTEVDEPAADREE